MVNFIYNHFYMTARIILVSFMLTFVTIGYSQNYASERPYKFIFKTNNGDSITKFYLIIKNIDTRIESNYFKIDSKIMLDTAKLQYLKFFVTGYKQIYISKSELIKIINKKFQKNIIIDLINYEFNLSEIEVTTKHSMPFYQKYKLEVVDYELMDNGDILMLTEQNIYLIDKSDSVRIKFNNAIKADSILKTCGELIFLKAKDQFYPLSLKRNEMIIGNLPIEKKLLFGENFRCVCSDKNIIVWQNYSYNGQKLLYRIETVTYPKRIFDFYTTTNEDLNLLINKISREIDTAITADKMGEINYQQNKKIKNKDQKRWQLNANIKKEIYCPIFLSNDTINIFDTNKKIILRYKYFISDSIINFETVFKDSMTFFNQKTFQNIIIHDSQNSNFYALYRSEGLKLMQIRTENNLKLYNYTFPKDHYFIEKIKVRNNRVYYLWRNRSDRFNYRTLYYIQN